MSVDDMRYVVSRVYGPRALKWKEKVARMSNNQIIAVYHSFVARGLIK